MVQIISGEDKWGKKGKLNSKLHDIRIRHTEVHFQIHVYTKEYHTIAFSINEQLDNNEEARKNTILIYSHTPYIFPAFYSVSL